MVNDEMGAVRADIAFNIRVHEAATKLVRRAEAHAYEAGSPATFYDAVSGEINEAGSDMVLSFKRAIRDLVNG